jgi:hypothetical protein
LITVSFDFYPFCSYAFLIWWAGCSFGGTTGLKTYFDAILMCLIGYYFLIRGALYIFSILIALLVFSGLISVFFIYGFISVFLYGFTSTFFLISVFVSTLLLPIFALCCSSKLALLLAFLVSISSSRMAKE